MLEKDFSVLRLRSVTGFRIHHELGIRQVLGQEEGVDRGDDDVFASMHDQNSLMHPRQHSVAVSRRNGTPFADRRQLSVCRLYGYWRVAVRNAKLQSLDIGLPRSLAALAGSKKRVHQQCHWIAQLVDRQLAEGHTFSTSRTCTEQDHPPNHVRVFECQLL